MNLNVFYRLIYQKDFNYLLRNLNKLFDPLLRGRIRINPSGILRVRMDNDRRLKIKTNQTNFVTKRIFWDKQGYKNFEYTPVFLRIIQRVSSFYDIGANIGFYSLIAACENSSLKVVCFEPAEGPLHFLKSNVQLNNFKNIRVESLALSDQKGEIDFYEVKNIKYSYLKYNLGGEGNAGSKIKDGFYQTTRIKTTTIDDYVLNNGDNIDLIKIDTEGTENIILANARFVLSQMKPIVVCETLFNKIESELELLFKSYGYEFYHFNGTGLTKIETITRKVDDGFRDCFFIHPDKFHLISDLVLK